jgi:hypothetical protein
MEMTDVEGVMVGVLALVANKLLLFLLLIDEVHDEMRLDE